MKNRIIIFRVVSVLFFGATIAASAFFVNEARKEIFYLCGNFKIGVLKKDVIRQLETGTFLEYSESKKDEHSLIEVSSKFTLNLVSCDIGFDADDSVIYARR
jgi:hypothetical protein